MITHPKPQPYDLEVRLLEFAARIIILAEGVKPTRAGSHVGSQLLRSGTSPYANHGEAEAAESREDFIHKLKICHKELRETRRWLRLVHRAQLHSEIPLIDQAINEADQLVRIFSASIRTAQGRGASQIRPTTPPARIT